MLKALMDKVDGMQNNVSREREIFKKNRKEMVKIKANTNEECL